MKRFESPPEKPAKVMDLNDNTIYPPKLDEDTASSPRAVRSNLKLNLSGSTVSGLESPGTNRHLSTSDHKLETGPGLSPRPSDLLTRTSSPRLSEINAIINGSHASPMADETSKHNGKDDDTNGSDSSLRELLCSWFKLCKYLLKSKLTVNLMTLQNLGALNRA